MNRHRSDRRRIQALRAFLTSEAAGGILLMAAAGLAIGVANSPMAAIYFDLLGRHVFGLSVLHWVNDALMAVFFLLVGLEIKREVLDGQLSNWTRRALPGFAALGGMIAPALVYVGVNAGSPESLRGWAIPAATDIAFALGVLSLLGRRVPVSLKVFLTALAILDDLGAVVIIAVFYTTDLSWLMLALAAVAVAALIAMNRCGVVRLLPYLVIGVLLWVFVLKSGLHATLAGVALALSIPLRTGHARVDDVGSPLHRLEQALHPWVAFLVIPIFGFANAGLSFADVGPRAMLDPVPLGIALGLFVGKQAGVFGFGWAAIRSGLADLPANATWLQFYGLSLLCGIGFTMSLFIGLLAFPTSQLLQDETKIGVLAGSILSGLAGWLVLRVASSDRDESTPPAPEKARLGA